MNIVVNMGSCSRNMAVLLVKSDMKPGFVIRGSRVQVSPPAPITPLDSAIAVTGDSAEPTHLENQKLTFGGHVGVQALRSLGWERRACLSVEALRGYCQSAHPTAPSYERIRAAMRSGLIGCLVGSLPTASDDLAVKHSRNESAAHIQLKRRGVSLLRGLGLDDVSCEVQIGYGVADVCAPSVRITVECGNTPPYRVMRVLREPIDARGASMTPPAVEVGAVLWTQPNQHYSSASEMLLDSGIHRHIKCRSEVNGWNQWFEVITWPGSLAISGDMGSWVFSRTDDMFRFFRSGELKINPHYWSEKLEVGRSEAREFSDDAFREDLLEQLADYGFEGERLAELTAALKQEVFNAYEGEHGLLQGAAEFKHGEFQFESCDLPSGKRWTYRFIWCLYAIVWAIQQYDELGKPTQPGATIGGEA